MAQIMKQNALLLLALGLGGMFAYVDSRPTWDDTGVMVMGLLATASVFGFLGPRKPWLWALALGVWIPLVGLVRTQNAGSIVALIVTFVGAYVGTAVRRALQPAHK